MYKDMILKIEYHKMKILNAFVKQGYFPTKDDITQSLNNIDERIALFKKYNFEPGELFNAKEMNYALKMLYNDILFLYKIVEDIYINKYNKLVLDVETHMVHLENLAEYFRKRGEEEAKSTSLGNTIFFAINGWEIERQDESIDVILGDIELVQGTEISCFANINNTDKKNVVFKFESEDYDKSFFALPYNYNNDTYIVPGDTSINEKTITLSESFNINSEVILPIEINTDNDYKIFSGKDKIVVTNKETNEVTLHDFPTSENPFIAKSNCYISFFMENKGQLEYSFSHRPLHCNFSIQNGIIQLNKDSQKIFLDVEKGFSCYFDLIDDDISPWAAYEDGIKNNGKLIYDGMLLTRDFKIKEYVRDKKTNYSLTVKIYETDSDEVIDSIYIKEVN